MNATPGRIQAEIELALDEERRRIAGEIHDAVNAAVLVIRLHAEGMTSPPSLLLCKSQNRVVAEYKLIEALPKELETTLPSIERIEAELSQAASEDQSP